MSSSDICADDFNRSIMCSAGKNTRFCVAATASLQHYASSRRRVAGITTRRFLKHCGDALRDRTVRAQKVCKRDGSVMSIPVDDPLIKTSFASDRRIETGCVDAQGVGQVRHADGVITPGMEQALSSCDGLIYIEFTRSTPTSNYFFRFHYKNP